MIKKTYWGYVCFGGPSGLDGSLVAGIWAFSGWRNGLKWMGFGGGPTPMKGTSPSYVGGPVGGPVGAAHAAVQRNARLGWDILIAFKKCMLRISLLAVEGNKQINSTLDYFSWSLLLYNFIRNEINKSYVKIKETNDFINIIGC